MVRTKKLSKRKFEALIESEVESGKLSFEKGRRLIEKQKGIRKVPRRTLRKPVDTFKTQTLVGRRALAQQEKVLSKEQNLLRGMFGGNFGKNILLDDPAQFNGANMFEFSKPSKLGHTGTSSMFDSSGNNTKQFFMPRRGGRI